MKKICAVQMDPLNSININGDSTFVCMLEAQIRGFSIFHYLAQNLTYNHGKLTARGHFVEMRRELGNHYSVLSEATIDLCDAKVILMRQDPPFHMGYITACHLLETIMHKVLIVNNPASVRSAPEKLSALGFSDLMPITMISKDIKEIQDFHKIHGEIVVKPLFGNGGLGVVKLNQDDPNLGAILELFNELGPSPIMAQKFIPKVVDGDKRIILIDGKAVAAINRRPLKGQIRSNMHVGGKPEACDLTAREQEICERLHDFLKDNGLIFTGIDVIDGLLTEINVTSPTGMQEMNRFYDIQVEAVLWNAIESKL